MSEQQKIYFDKEIKELNVFRNITDSARNYLKRFRADSQFIVKFKKVLLNKASFYYDFKNLEGVYVLTSPDKAFRIYTWQYTYDKIRYFHHGVVQLKLSKNKIKLIPLFDKSNYIKNPLDEQFDSKSWIGCNYYKCKIFKSKDKTYYVLFGFDPFTIRSNIRWLEVLTIKDGEIFFGAPIFAHYDPRGRKTKKYFRKSFEYQDFSNSILVFDEDKDAIIFDKYVNLSYVERSYLNTISGSYSGYKWDAEKGNFIFVENMFDNQDRIIAQDLPLEAVISNDGINFDQDFIKKQNKKNFSKEKKNK